MTLPSPRQIDTNTASGAKAITKVDDPAGLNSSLSKATHIIAFPVGACSGRPEKVMGELVVTEFVSVDGVFEDPGGSEDYEHGAWTFEYNRGDDGNQFKLDELMEAEVQLFGRVTYEALLPHGPLGRAISQTQSITVGKSSLHHPYRTQLAELDSDL